MLTSRMYIGFFNNPLHLGYFLYSIEERINVNFMFYAGGQIIIVATDLIDESGGVLLLLCSSSLWRGCFASKEDQLVLKSCVALLQMVFLTTANSSSMIHDHHKQN